MVQQVHQGNYCIWVIPFLGDVKIDGRRQRKTVIVVLDTFEWRACLDNDPNGSRSNQEVKLLTNKFATRRKTFGKLVKKNRPQV